VPPAPDEPRSVARVDDRGCGAQEIIDAALCRRRIPVERNFCKRKHVRGIAAGFARRAGNFPAAIPPASTRLWTKACLSTT
jgi:transposase